MLSALLNFFVSAQCLVALAALLGLALRRLGRSRRIELSAAGELRVHYALLGLLAVALLVPVPGGSGELALHPVAHVEAGRPVPRSAAPTPPVVTLSGSPARMPGIPLEAFGWAALLLTLLGAAGSAADYLRLARLLRRAVVFRRIGRVRIAVLDGIASPFSARLGAAWVVLPSRSLADPRELRIALAHELQHHRSGDTAWAHALAALRALCFFHPLRALWAAAMAEAQELACDAVLVEQKRISAGDYSRCLLHAAEMAAREGAGRAIAAAPALISARRLLARRIESMYQPKRNNRSLVVFLALGAGFLLAAGAWASGSWVVDTRISARKMVEMAREARKGTGFPIEVNELVLRELNRFLGTEKGRAFVARAETELARLRPLLDRQLAQHRLPEELLAVGLVESGFQNLPQSANPSQHGAGVWQFIPSTARVFGLRVDAGADERLDVERETDAAFRYLAANQARFGDWRLALMAYNMGEKALDAAIRRAGTREPWKLIRLGYEHDENYLAKVMAAVLVLKDRAGYR